MIHSPKQPLCIWSEISLPISQLPSDWLLLTGKRFVNCAELCEDALLWHHSEPRIEKKNCVKLSVIKIKAKMKLGVRKSNWETKCSRWCFTLVQTLQVTNESSSPTGRDGVKRNVFGVCDYCHSHEFKETLINMKYSLRSGWQSEHKNTQVERIGLSDALLLKLNQQRDAELLKDMLAGSEVMNILLFSLRILLRVCSFLWHSMTSLCTRYTETTACSRHTCGAAQSRLSNNKMICGHFKDSGVQ